MKRIYLTLSNIAALNLMMKNECKAKHSVGVCFHMKRNRQQFLSVIPLSEVIREEPAHALTSEPFMLTSVGIILLYGKQHYDHWAVCQAKRIVSLS